MRGLICFGVLAFSVMSATAAQAERRVALVIGNSKYEAVSELINPRNDAIAVDRALRNIGFDDVRLVENLDQRGLLRALKQFSDVAAGAETAVIYYAGHGVEIDGRNYLVPTDATLAKASDVEFEAVLLDNARTAVSGAAKLRLVIVDACRNNPFKLASADGKRSVGRGLARVEPGSNELVAYAAREGTVASDGTGTGNSPYAAALIKYIAEPGLEIRLLFGRVRDEVMSTTGKSQEPFVYGSLGGEALYLNPPPAGAGAGPLPPRADQETAFWNTIKDSSTAADFDAYLKQYPGGAFAPLAQIRLAALTPADKPRPALPPVACEGGLVASLGGAGLAEAARRCLKPGDAFRDLDGGPEMVVVPAGAFTMGSGRDEKDRDADEGPQHDVTIAAPFAVGKFEVTRGEFAAFVTATGRETGSSCWVLNGTQYKETKGNSWREPGYTQADDHPVACVSWEDAKAYVAWLAKESGRDYRLLSEAEWEYAARGQTGPGDYPRFHFGNNESDLCDYANAADNSTSLDWRNKSCSDGVGDATAPVGRYKPNAFGLYDMHGNVWEWTADCYNDGYAGAPKDGSAWTSGSCEYRVLRGGAWDIRPRSLRAANRNWDQPDVRNHEIGFRVAKAL